MAGDAMLGVEVLSTKRNITGGKGKYEITMRDGESKKIHKVYTDMVVNATGVGEPNNLVGQEANGQNQRVVTFIQFMQMLDHLSPQETATLFTSADIALVGGGDSAYVAIEKIIEKVKELEVKGVAIDLFGAQFKTPAEFVQKTIDRYMGLLPYMHFPGQEYLPVSIRPYSEKVNAIKSNDQGLFVISHNGVGKPYNLVIDATGFKNNAAALYDNFSGAQLPVYEGIQHQQVATKIDGEDIYFVGPSANISYTQEELTLVPDKMRDRFQHSLRRLIPRTVLLAQQVAHAEEAVCRSDACKLQEVREEISGYVRVQSSSSGAGEVVAVPDEKAAAGFIALLKEKEKKELEKNAEGVPLLIAFFLMFFSKFFSSVLTDENLLPEGENV